MLRMVFALVLVVGCLASMRAQTSRPAPATSKYPVQYNPRLKSASKSDIEQKLRAPFEEGVEHPAGINNCVQMLAKCSPAAHGKCAGQPANVSDRDFQAQKMTLVDCLVLQILEGAAPAIISYVAMLKWNEEVLPLLPPQLAITVSKDAALKAKAAAKSGESWVDFDKTISAGAGAGDRITVRGKGFDEQLILWGRGDLNGDGMEDLLVQSLDSLTEGTYRSTRLFILTRRSPDSQLSVARTLF